MQVFLANNIKILWTEKYLHVWQRMSCFLHNKLKIAENWSGLP